jgi:hypothetical protein
MNVDDEGDSSMVCLFEYQLIIVLKDDFQMAMNKFLHSQSTRDKIWGVIGTLMQLKAQLSCRK